jgi:HAD superfamily hydrolase (TIGR01509 family)
VLSQLELSGFFDIVITKENVTKHKPDPEAYVLALEKLSLPSSEVLIFEDSNAGLVAARNANCDVVAFKHEFNANHDLSLAIQTISDFNEFLI